MIVIRKEDEVETLVSRNCCDGPPSCEMWLALQLSWPILGTSRLPHSEILDLTELSSRRFWRAAVLALCFRIAQMLLDEVTILRYGACIAITLASV